MTLVKKIVALQYHQSGIAGVGASQNQDNISHKPRWGLSWKDMFTRLLFYISPNDPNGPKIRRYQRVL